MTKDIAYANYFSLFYHEHKLTEEKEGLGQEKFLIKNTRWTIFYFNF